MLNVNQLILKHSESLFWHFLIVYKPEHEKANFVAGIDQEQPVKLILCT